MLFRSLQALALYNNKFILHFSGMLAKAIDKEKANSHERAAEAYSRVLSRAPSAEEARMAADLITRHGTAELCRVLFNTHEFLFVE